MLIRYLGFLKILQDNGDEKDVNSLFLKAMNMYLRNRVQTAPMTS